MGLLSNYIMVNLLFYSDPHGRVSRTRLAKYVKTYNIDAIICCGDVCDDRYIRPIAKRAAAQGVHWSNLVTDSQVLALRRKTMQSGKEVIQVLASQKIPLYIIPGNWDISLNTDFASTYCKQQNVIVVDTEFAVHESFGIVGYGKVSHTELQGDSPKSLKEYTQKYKQMEKAYEKLALKCGADKPILLLSHNPPYNTQLDWVENSRSGKKRAHVGSLVIRRLVEQFSPSLVLCGHIHERKGTCKLRKTGCINGGQAGVYVISNTAMAVSKRSGSTSDSTKSSEDSLLHKKLGKWQISELKR